MKTSLLRDIKNALLKTAPIITVLCFLLLPSTATATVFQLQDATSHNLGDAAVYNAAPTTTYTEMWLKARTTPQYTESYIKFNTSAIPDYDAITDATLALHMSYNDILVNEGIDVFHVYNNYTWDAGTITWNTKPASGSEYNPTAYETAYLPASTTGWVYLDITDLIQLSEAEGHENVSLRIWLNTTYTASDQISVDSEENATVSVRPYINVTYIDYSPVTTISAPTEGQDFTSLSVNLSYSVADDNNDTLTSYIFSDGVLNTNESVDNTTTYTHTITYSATGSHNITVSVYDGAEWSNETVTFNVTDTFLSSGPCSGVNISSLNMTLLDSDEAAVQGAIEVSFTEYYGLVENNFSFSFSNITYGEVCISPTTATATTDAFMVYSADGYSPQTYYLNNAELTNVTQTLEFYLDLNTSTTLIKMRVLNSLGLPAEDILINIARYDIGTNTYSTVAIGRTDFDGYAYAYLVQDIVWYRFALYDEEGENLDQYGPIIVTDDTLTFQLTEQTYGEWLDHYDQISGSCTFPSNTTTCTVTDTSGLMQSATLVVKRWTSLGYIDVCEESGSSSSLTLVCDLGTVTGRIFWYEFTAHFQNTHEIIESGYLDNSQDGNPDYEEMGLLASVMMILVLSMFGYWRWEVGLVFAGIGFGASWAAGILIMAWGSVVTIFVIIGLVLYKARTT